MRAKELVPILAEIYGVPFEAAFMIDRSLAESGLREKGRGRSLPEMTRKEAIIFLLACMVAQKATRAGEEVSEWLQFRDAIIKPSPATDLMDGEYDEEFAKRKRAFDLIEPLMEGFKKDGSRDVGVVNFLLIACHILETSPIYGVKLVCELAHRQISVEIHDALDGLLDTYFFYESGAGTPDVQTGIYRGAHVFGEALLAIVARTENPLDKIEGAD